jgi:hypothetical protein
MMMFVLTSQRSSYGLWFENTIIIDAVTTKKTNLTEEYYSEQVTDSYLSGLNAL